MKPTKQAKLRKRNKINTVIKLQLTRKAWPKLTGQALRHGPTSGQPSLAQVSRASCLGHVAKMPMPTLAQVPLADLLVGLSFDHQNKSDHCKLKIFRLSVLCNRLTI